MSISLCMIAKNEAEFIEQAISSVKGIVGQIVVVDTGSSDDTAGIAKRLGAEVYRFEWADDFSAARNESLRHAKGDWILVLDADETIAASDLDRIRRLIADSEYDGYALVQRNYTNDTYREDFLWAINDSYEESRNFTGWVPRLIVRLFRNKSEIRFEGIVHELVETSIKKSGGKYFPADIPIHHFNALKAAHVLAWKSAYYRKIVGQKLAAEPDNAGIWHEMGTVERGVESFAKAKKHFEKAIELDDKFVEAYQSLGVCCSKLGELDKAIAAFKKAIELNEHYPMPYFSLGVAYYRKGMLNAARDAIEEGLKRNPNDFNAITNLGAIYEQGGHPEKAVEVLRHVVGIDKNNARAFYNLGVALERLGRNREAADAYEKSASLGYFRKEEALSKAARLRVS